MHFKKGDENLMNMTRNLSLKDNKPFLKNITITLDVNEAIGLFVELNNCIQGDITGELRSYLKSHLEISSKFYGN